jgi:hypothetical protein
MNAVSTGRYHFGGWRVIGARSVGRMASVHEAWHDRLQFTTSYGLLVQHLWALGEATEDPAWTTQADELLLGARRGHEEFASIMTEMTSADLVAPLRAEYPMYAKHADRAVERVGTSSAYTRLHRISALYRASMQPSGASQFTENLAVAIAAALPRTARPDHRLRMLTAALGKRGWPSEPDDDTGEQTLRRYADETDDHWETASRRSYDWCRTLLIDAGCDTLPYDGQLERVDQLNAHAVELAGQPIRLIAMPASTAERESDVDIVLRAFESETLEFAPPPVVQTAPPTTTVAEMISGTGHRRHLFVSIRPASRHPSPRTTSPTTTRHDALAPHTAFARSSSRDADGATTVTLKPLTVTDLDRLDAAGLPIVVSVSMMSLGNEQVRRDWLPLLQAARCTVLIDLPLTRHIRTWVTETGGTVRYGLGEYVVTGRAGICLAARVKTELGASRVHLAVVSPSFAAAFEVWIAESPDIRESVIRDDRLLDQHEPLISPTMGHLLIEEPYFDFKAGVAGGTRQRD